MKFTSAILALCAVSQAAAFAPQTSSARSTALNSMQPSSSGFSAPNGVGGVGAASQGTQSSFSSAPGMGSPGMSGMTSPDMNQQQSAPGAMKKAGGPGMSAISQPADKHIAKDIWETSMSQETVQGGSLRTWSFTTNAIERVLVCLKSEGRPLNANVELWNGPDYTPLKMNVYSEDGNLRPFTCVIETPRSQNAVAIRNTGQMEFPLAACLDADVENETGSGFKRLGAITQELINKSIPKRVQGGAIHTYPFSPQVQSVQVSLKTDGRPLNARLELLQGPNNNKQVIDIYSEDGMERPFFAVIETPGSGNVVRIINTATVEFPMDAAVEPYVVEQAGYGDSGGDSRNYFIVD